MPKKSDYRPPELTEIGSMQELTGADMEGSGDGGNLKPLGSL